MSSTPPRAAEHESAVQPARDGEVELSIVMPCLNEAETLASCIRKAQGFLQRHAIAGEIVIGDNGSTDGSQQIALELGARVVDVPVRGYGAAVHAAVEASRGRYAIMGDSDDSYDFSALDAFVQPLRAGYDLVMGNRFRGGILPGAMPWKNRWIGNPILTAVGRLFFRSPAGDFHCGLRGFSRAAFDRMQLRTTGMELASEMVIKATLLGMRITEVPVQLHPDGRSRPPHLRPWRDGWRHLRFMLLYSPAWLFLYPGLALMIAGLLVGTWLLPRPRPVGSVVLDVHTLLYAVAAVLIGFQAVLFATLARTFAAEEGLLPQTPWLDGLYRYFSLEVGLVAGALLVLAGLAGSVAAVLAWAARDFGPLDPLQTLRVAVPSVLALILGLQVMLSSFFLSVLGLRMRGKARP